MKTFKYLIIFLFVLCCNQVSPFPADADPDPIEAAERDKFLQLSLKSLTEYNLYYDQYLDTFIRRTISAAAEDADPGPIEEAERENLLQLTLKAWTEYQLYKDQSTSNADKLVNRAALRPELTTLSELSTTPKPTLPIQTRPTKPKFPQELLLTITVKSTPKPDPTFPVTTNPTKPTSTTTSHWTTTPSYQQLVPASTVQPTSKPDRTPVTVSTIPIEPTSTATSSWTVTTTPSYQQPDLTSTAKPTSLPGPTPIRKEPTPPSRPPNHQPDRIGFLSPTPPTRPIQTK